jgi:hypothetical protein
MTSDNLFRDHHIHIQMLKQAIPITLLMPRCERAIRLKRVFQMLPKLPETYQEQIACLLLGAIRAPGIESHYEWEKV